VNCIYLLTRSMRYKWQKVVHTDMQAGIRNKNLVFTSEISVRGVAEEGMVEWSGNYDGT